jgi:NADH-quinone oxidoreductase subunit C
VATNQSNDHTETEKTQPSFDVKDKGMEPLLIECLKEFNPQISSSLDDAIVAVPRELVVEIGRKLKDDDRTLCDFLRCLSVVDYEDHFQVVYHLYSTQKNHHLVMKSDIPYEDPHISSVMGIWLGADWYEREGHDLFGIIFDGHPNLTPLILYEGFEGYPGRKSYPINDYKEW